MGSSEVMSSWPGAQCSRTIPGGRGSHEPRGRTPRFDFELDDLLAVMDMLVGEAR